MRVDLSTTKPFSHPKSTVSSLHNGLNPNDAEVLAEVRAVVVGHLPRGRNKGFREQVRREAETSGDESRTSSGDGRVHNS